MLNKHLDKEEFYWRQEGFCFCCDRETEFMARDSWLRDQFKCSHCDSVPRERALMRVIEMLYPNWRDLDIHESSPNKRAASAKLKDQCPKYLASQYFPAKPFGSTVDGYRNEDLTQQTFAKSSFDLVITQDVMEHIYTPDKAFSEIARTLKPGGAHIFTVPIYNKHWPSQVWAVPGADGEPEFLHTPEYHGNPVDRKGSPVTMHWGYDITDYILEHSGLKTSIYSLDEKQHGIRAQYVEVLVTKKPITLLSGIYQSLKSV